MIRIIAAACAVIAAFILGSYWMTDGENATIKRVYLLIEAGLFLALLALLLLAMIARGDIKMPWVDKWILGPIRRIAALTTEESSDHPRPPPTT